MSVLPSGWAQTTVGEVCNYIQRGKSPKYVDISDLPVINQKCVRWWGIDEKYLKYVNPDQWSSWSEERFLIPGDVLWNSTGTGTIGRAALFGGLVTAERAVVDSHVTVLRPSNAVSGKFVHYFIQSPLVQNAIVDMQSGTTNQVELNRTEIVGTAIALPPLAEQKRIVAKLDALNAKSARARAELIRIETLVTRYKQAVLSKAFNGELIGLTPVETLKPHVLCWDLPLGWQWVAFKDAVEIASNLVNPATILDLPHIAPDNIEGATTRLLPFRTIGEDGVISAKHRFYPGQVLYSKIRPYLRKAVIVDFEGACSADMYPLSPRDGVLAPYLLQWLVSEQFTTFAIEHQGRTVLPKINQKALNQTPFPLAPLVDQVKINHLIKSAFEKIDLIAVEAKRALKLVGKLDDAILAKAFRGELVPQDKNDEPASVLLERIRNEREFAPKAKRGRKKQ